VSVIDRLKVLRSKNAGPFALTFDILFDEPGDFARVRATLDASGVARAFAIPVGDVIGISHYPPLMATKVSIRRRIPAGQPGDSDCYGMNQEQPLAWLLEELVA
jgi:hypothetical protein